MQGHQEMINAIAHTIRAINDHPEGKHPMTASEALLIMALISAVGRDKARELINPEEESSHE
jgi:hypothetical protein